MHYKISILIANYNNGKYFNDCWKSIINQTYTNWEVIIVDDKSTDNSLDLINNIIKDDKRVKIFVNNKNFGCGYTKRRCAELATGDLYGFLDPDDALEPNALEVMNLIFTTNSLAVLAYSKHTKCDENLKCISNKYDTKLVDTQDLYFFNINAIISHLCVFRASAYKKTEGIDPYMLRAVDQDLYLKLCEQGPTLAVDEYLYKYRIHSNGISTGTGYETVSKAEYWHWYAINAAAKRRGIYVENLFIDFYINKSIYNALVKNYQLIKNSGSYKLSQKISGLRNIFKKNK